MAHPTRSLRWFARGVVLVLTLTSLSVIEAHQTAPAQAFSPGLAIAPALAPEIGPALAGGGAAAAATATGGAIGATGAVTVGGVALAGIGAGYLIGTTGVKSVTSLWDWVNKPVVTSGTSALSVRARGLQSDITISGPTIPREPTIEGPLDNPSSYAIDVYYMATRPKPVGARQWTCRYSNGEVQGWGNVTTEPAPADWQPRAQGFRCGVFRSSPGSYVYDAWLVGVDVPDWDGTLTGTGEMYATSIRTRWRCYHATTGILYGNSSSVSGIDETTGEAGTYNVKCPANHIMGFYSVTDSLGRVLVQWELPQGLIGNPKTPIGSPVTPRNASGGTVAWGDVDVSTGVATDAATGQRTGPGTCQWGTQTLQPEDCYSSFSDVYRTWTDRSRVLDYGYDPIVDENGERRRGVGACLAVASTQDCKDKPVFLPGADVYEAAEHDSEAIVNGHPAVLTYYPSKPDPLTLADGTTVSHSWYKNETICKQGAVGDGRDCDEYPYWSTVEGGPGASLKLVKASDNQREGRLLVGFATRCGLTTTSAREFITAPVVAVGDVVNRPGSASMAYCAGQIIVPPAGGVS